MDVLQKQCLLALWFRIHPAGLGPAAQHVQVELTDSTGARLAPSASTMTGVSDDHPVSNVVDGDRSSFHAGDWDATRPQALESEW